MNQLDGDLFINGRLRTRFFTPPEQSIRNEAIASDAAVAATKLQHQHCLSYQQAGGTDVTDATHLLHIAAGDGALAGLSVRPVTAPTGGDKAYTVDLQKAVDGSNSWTSLLNAPIEISVAQSSADHTLQQAILAASPAYAAGDALRLVITTSGSTGSQGQGVLVTVTLREAA